MTIYVVTSGEYSGYGIEAVFTDEGKANVYCAGHYDEYSQPKIEVWETSDEKIESDADTIWEYKMHTDNVKSHYPHISRCLVKHELGQYSNRIEIEDRCPVVYVYLDECNERKACKIAQDVFAKYKAEKAGIS